MSSNRYVDALVENAGVALSQVERSKLIDREKK